MSNIIFDQTIQNGRPYTITSSLLGQTLPLPETQIYKEISLEQNNVIYLIYNVTIPHEGDMFISSDTHKYKNRNIE